MHPTLILATFSNISGRPKDIESRGFILFKQLISNSSDEHVLIKNTFSDILHYWGKKLTKENMLVMFAIQSLRNSKVHIGQILG